MGSNSARADQIEATCVCESECKIAEPLQCHADVMIMMDSSACHQEPRWKAIRDWSFKAATQLKV